MADADFIAVYPDALDAGACRAIVDRFEADDAVAPGHTGGGLFPELKHSDDIRISGRTEWLEIERSLNNAALGGLIRYLRACPHALIAPLMLEQPGPDGARRRLTAEAVAAMEPAALARLALAAFRPGTINLQRYRAGAGGYPYWHCELYPRHPDAETLHRHLLWTIYLNEDFSEGETEFLYQQRRIAPRTGALLIAPAAFTHTHRGNRPQGGDKYIATSWILFRRAAKLYRSETDPINPARSVP